MIAVDDPSAADVRALLARHRAFADLHSPPEDIHALGVDALLDPAVTFCSLRDDDDGVLVAVGALKRIDDEHAEIKSMHTAEAARRQGAGRTMLSYLLELARTSGYRRVSLETGSMDAFGPARAMYAAAGFVACGPFADYPQSSYSTWLTLELG